MTEDYRHKNRIKQLWRKYREPMLYIFFGMLSSLNSMLFYRLLTFFFSFNGSLLPTVLIWILNTFLAFLTTKYIIFRKKSSHVKAWLEELVQYISLRLSCLVIDVLIMWAMVDILLWNPYWMKMLSMNIGGIGSYFLGKYLIFINKS